MDRLRSKRALIAAGVIALAIGALLIAFFPSFWPVIDSANVIGGMSSIFMPAIAAISIGIVGPELFDLPPGRNQTFNSAGNVAAAVMMGLIGYFISNRGIFFFVGSGGADARFPAPHPARRDRLRTRQGSRRTARMMGTPQVSGIY